MHIQAKEEKHNQLYCYEFIFIFNDHETSHTIMFAVSLMC